jgi:uncharacterized protein YbjQ (UPF0145 family)
MITVTTETVSGSKVVKVCGLVEGSTVRVRHVGRNIMAGIKSLFGGEIVEYSHLLSEAREEATSRMVAAAEQAGANAVVNIRFATAEIMSGASEILAYGTAVVIEDE